MKSSFKFYLLIIVLCIFSNRIKAQSESAISSLYFNPSPELTGLGWNGVSFPNDDAFGFYYNPAMLGYFSQNKNAAVQYAPETDWLNIGDMKINSFALSLGYNFKDLLNGLNLSAGFGFIKNKFDLSEIMRGNADSYNDFGFGISLDYFVNLCVGISYKKINSTIKYFWESSQYEANASAIDYGFLLKVPVIKLIDKNLEWELSEKVSLKPVFSYALGYSRSNIGDEVYYIDRSQSDPLPLTARLGHTLTFGFNLKTNNAFFKLLTYNLILEADDILIERQNIFDPASNSISTFSYQGMLGDIKFGKHLIQLKGDDKVIVHKGHKINFGETIAILRGLFFGRAYSRGIETGGIIISSKGITKLFSSLSNSSLLNYLAKHFELKYINASIFRKENFETTMSGIELTFSNFSF